MYHKLPVERTTSLIRGTYRGDRPSPTQPCPSHPPHALTGLGRTQGHHPLPRGGSQLPPHTSRHTTHSEDSYGSGKGKINSGIQKSNLVDATFPNPLGVKEKPSHIISLTPFSC